MRHYIKPFVALSGIMLAFSFGMARFSSGTDEKRQADIPQQVYVAEQQPVIRNVLENPEVEKARPVENIVQDLQKTQNSQDIAIIKPGSANARGNGDVTIVNALSAKTQMADNAGQKAAQAVANYDEIMMKPKPVLLMEGEGTWENQLKDIQNMREAMETAARERNMVVDGSPIMVFLETRTNSYRYEFMLPVASIPEPEPALPKGMSYSLTPNGPAYRFMHKGAYKGIEKTYGTISSYLASKNVDVKDVYLEEYPTSLRSNNQAVSLVNIYVFPRQLISKKPTL